MSNSDAETVLGDDSPLSPCVWAGAQLAPEAARPATATATATATAAGAEPPVVAPSGARTSPARGRPTLSADSREMRAASTPLSAGLQLSPASQLNVLSQISELADAKSAASAAAPRPSCQPPRPHVWVPAAAKRKQSVDASTKPPAKKQKKTPALSLAERLAADMLDWETCSEGDLFAVGEDAAAELDEWVYEDISDSDFEA